MHWPAECPLQLKLGHVEIDCGVDQFALRCVERLYRLQNFDRQPLSFTDAAEISVVRSASRLDARLGDSDAIPSRVHAGLCLGHFSGDLIHHLNFSAACCLLHACASRFAGSLLAEPQIANLP